MAEVKNPVPRQLAPHVFKRGHHGGRPSAEDRSTRQVTKRLTKAMAVVCEMECPSDWMKGGLEPYAFQNLNVGEVIALRAAACAAAGVRYPNVGLLEALLSRLEGKIPLKVIRSEAPADDDEFIGLSDIELSEQIAAIMTRMNDTLPPHLQLPIATPAAQPAPEAATESTSADPASPSQALQMTDPVAPGTNP